MTTKAGIITFHNAENYGAALQTYALMKTLQDLGCDCQVIDYRNKGVFYRNAIKNLYYLLTFQRPLKNHLAYRNFRKTNLNLTDRVYRKISDFAADAGQFEVLFFGSDQIWNPDLSNGFDLFYFGQFATPAKKIAYAASVGKDDLSAQERQAINQLITDFDAVAVREENLLPILIRDATCVVDPCMLLTADAWNKLASEPKLDSAYILVYQLFPNKDLLMAARACAREYNLQIAVISPYLSTPSRGQVKKLGRISPTDFLAYYRDADMVISDSFHGTLFSILYQKPFYTLLPAEKTGRITSLLNRLDLVERIIHRPEVIPQDVDYSRVTPLLQREVSRSLAFIKENLP